MEPAEMKKNYFDLAEFKNSTSLFCMANNLNKLKLYRKRDATIAHDKLKSEFVE
jgi:hypothetical protein